MHSGLGVPRAVRVGVGGSGDGKARLIDSLRRRYGRRRAVVASLGEAIEVADHAVDLVLVELGEQGEAPGVEAETLDATIGVLGASAVADAVRRDDHTLDAWHVLVVSVAGEAKADLSRLEEDTGWRRGQRPVAFVDLATGQGIDLVTSWLQREWGLDPWRARRG